MACRRAATLGSRVGKAQVARERPAVVETGPIALSFPACCVARVVVGFLGWSARTCRGVGFRVLGFRSTAIFVHGAEGFSFLDANAVGVTVSPISEINLVQGECSEAGCVVDLQYPLLKWQLSDEKFAWDYRQRVEHLGGWKAQNRSEPLRPPDLEELVTLSGCGRENEQFVHRFLYSVGLNFQIHI